MSVTTISGPAAEPLTLAQVKAQLRVTTDAEDSYIEDDLIPAARAEVETFTRLRLITQTVRITLDQFPHDGPVVLPVWPVQSISSVQYRDEAGDWQTLAASGYELVDSVKPRRIVPPYQGVWPVAREYFASVRIEVVAGFGNAGSDVPPDLLQAMRLIVGAKYENREATVIGTISGELPMGAVEMMRPHVLHFEGC